MIPTPTPTTVKPKLVLMPHEVLNLSKCIQILNKHLTIRLKQKWPKKPLRMMKKMNKSLRKLDLSSILLTSNMNLIQPIHQLRSQQRCKMTLITTMIYSTSHQLQRKIEQFID